ncbi:hypothetical protein CesoFtcFv8_004232 [Champsocephalus esox]|uniref:Uncharacterized protein n=2 Tax=Champsocephalus TaxID=52236 RepID=A0AAN8E4J6_CHAGU|nr:hypothetical protein CesoFtcFv8_004232 [Champsocephalus esox]KAK5932972.1 hypothetical protein CgunFtcFv8_004639 [Champsocephalus gunnari]
MELRAGAVASARSSVLGPGAGFHGTVPAQPHGPLIFHCHRAGEEEIKTNMWWQGELHMMNRCNQYRLAVIGGGCF